MSETSNVLQWFFSQVSYKRKIKEKKLSDEDEPLKAYFEMKTLPLGVMY